MTCLKVELTSISSRVSVQHSGTLPIYQQNQWVHKIDLYWSCNIHPSVSPSTCYTIFPYFNCGCLIIFLIIQTFFEEVKEKWANYSKDFKQEDATSELFRCATGSLAGWSQYLWQLRKMILQIYVTSRKRICLHYQLLEQADDNTNSPHQSSMILYVCTTVF